MREPTKSQVRAVELLVTAAVRLLPKPINKDDIDIELYFANQEKFDKLDRLGKTEADDYLEAE